MKRQYIHVITPEGKTLPAKITAVLRPSITLSILMRVSRSWIEKVVASSRWRS